LRDLGRTRHSSRMQSLQCDLGTTAKTMHSQFHSQSTSLGCLFPLYPRSKRLFALTLVWCQHMESEGIFRTQACIPNITKLFFCIPTAGGRVEGILSIIFTNEIADMNVQNSKGKTKTKKKAQVGVLHQRVTELQYCNHDRNSVPPPDLCWKSSNARDTRSETAFSIQN